MSTTTRRTILASLVVLALLAGALWFAIGHGGEQPSEEDTGVAVLPSDGGSYKPQADKTAPTADEDTPEARGDFTDPEALALAFMSTYPDDVEALSDPTLLASLDGVEASLVEQVTDISVEEVDHSVDEIYERYAYTVSGAYQGAEMPIYTIVVGRPAEPGEGGSTTENDLPFQVHSFDWAPDMLGGENQPGPAAGELSPISAEQRGDLISQTRTDVITPILTVDPDESTEQRQKRLDELMVEPTAVTPPMSRSGRYAMTTEILSQAYNTEPGGPITINYTGTWVDPYDPSYNGSWSLTATITRNDNGTFLVHSVEETAPIESNWNDE